MSAQAVTVSEFARMKGVSHEAVRKAIISKRLVNSIIYGQGKKPKINPVLAAEEWEKNTDHSMRFVGKDVRVVPQPQPERPAAAPRLVDDAAPSTGLSLNQSRQVHEAYKARLAKLEYEEKSGKLVEAERVKDEAFKIARTVRDVLMNIPDRVAAEFAGISNTGEIHSRLSDEIRIALESLTLNAVD